MIMKGRTSLRLTSVGIGSLALMAAATLPTWAASPQVPQPPVVLPSAAPPAATTMPAQSAPQAMAAPQLRPTSVPPVMQMPTRRPSVAQRPTAAPPRAVAAQVPGGRGRATSTAALPEAARALADAFSTDQQSYLEEAARKISARREVFTTEMQRLQDEYTKAGNLDAAVAVRDYLQRGTSTSALRPTTGRGGRGGVAAPVAARGRGRGVGGGGR